MTKKFWATWETRRKLLTNFEVFCLEHRVDEIAAMKDPGDREQRELRLIISILEVGYNRIIYGNGAT